MGRRGLSMSAGIEEEVVGIVRKRLTATISVTSHVAALGPVGLRLLA